MPRKSAAALSISAAPPLTAPLRPPRGMSARSAAIFRELVSSVEPGHFEASDSPLLRQYCVAVEIAERAEQALLKDGPITAGRTSPWVITQEKSLRSIVALSQRLRLSPQARHAANRRRLPSLGDY